MHVVENVQNTVSQEFGCLQIAILFFADGGSTATHSKAISMCMGLDGLDNKIALLGVKCLMLSMFWLLREMEVT